MNADNTGLMLFGSNTTLRVVSRVKEFSTWNGDRPVLQDTGMCLVMRGHRKEPDIEHSMKCHVLVSKCQLQRCLAYGCELENVAFDNMGVMYGTECSLDRIPYIHLRTNMQPEPKLAIIKRIMENDELLWYVTVHSGGEMLCYHPVEAAELVKRGIIYNAKIVKKNGKEFISAIKKPFKDCQYRDIMDPVLHTVETELSIAVPYGFGDFDTSHSRYDGVVTIK